jgi:hypothetical protein
MKPYSLLVALSGGLLVACAATPPVTSSAKAPSPTVAVAQIAAPAPPAYASTYRPMPATNTLLRGATVLTGTGERLENADVLLVDGKVAALGQGLAVPAGAVAVDAKGLWITPGIIDAHSHLGVYPSPGMRSLSDGNEATSPNTAQV